MWEIPEVDGVESDKTHEYQGVGVRNLDQAVLQGWVPVEKDDKVGKNWPIGPNGYRMFQEQVLCKITKARWNALQKDIDDMREALSIRKTEKDFKEQVGEDRAYGDIRDG